MIAEVIIHSNVKNLNRIFDYQIPANLENKISIGSRILVPFGNMKKLEDAIVIGIKEFSDYKVKEIASVQNEQILTKENIELGKWMARRYFCNIFDSLKLMLPPGTTSKEIQKRAKEKNINFVTLKKEIDEIEYEIETGKIKSDRQIRTLRFVIENGDILVSELEIFADTTRAVVNTLCKNGYLEMIEKQVIRNPFENKQIEKTEKLKLNKEQQIAYDTIADSMDDMLFSEFLIYGITGSRKNRNIYAIN